MNAEFKSAISLAVTRFGYCCKREREIIRMHSEASADTFVRSAVHITAWQ